MAPGRSPWFFFLAGRAVFGDNPLVISRTLSKSDFKVARTCAAKLFFRENHYPDNLASNHYLALLADGGYMVEALAKAHYPAGIQLAYGSNIEDDFARTVAFLQRETVVLFEATVLVGRRLARIDILEKKGNAIRLIEVKSKSFDGAAHAKSIAEGGPGVLRGKRKPQPVLSDWVEKIEDVAFQTLLLRSIMPEATIMPYLALVDKDKEAGLDGVSELFELEYTAGTDGLDRIHTVRYVGTHDQLAQLDLLTEIDVSAEVELLQDGVSAAALQFEARLDAPLEDHLQKIERGAKCRVCEFRVPVGVRSGFRDCWGSLADPSPHLLDLYSVGNAKAPDGTALVDWMVSNSRTSLLDIPLDGLCRADGTVGPQAERQLRQIEFTRRREVYVRPELRDRIDALGGPLYFIDFEGSRLALPYHAGMKPYGNVAFQWSCHTVQSPGERPQHAEWLNDSEVWPNQVFAESLRTAIGDNGPVLTWSGYEGAILKELVTDLGRFRRDAPDLIQWMNDVVDRRIVDLHQWAKEDYFHPEMGGRTGIKFVLDATWRSDAEMRQQFEDWTGLVASVDEGPYAALPPVEIAGVLQNVHEGTGATRAYQEMMFGAQKHDPPVREAWATLLRQYCHLDTLSMVLILEHWRRLVAPLEN